MCDFPQGILGDGGATFSDKFADKDELAAQMAGLLRMCPAGHKTNFFAYVSRQQINPLASVLSDEVTCFFFLLK